MEVQEIIDAVEVELTHTYGDLKKRKNKGHLLDVPYIVLGVVVKALKRIVPPAIPLTTALPSTQPLPPASDDHIADDELNLLAAEKLLITKACRKYPKDMKNAAKVLGISERTLYRKKIDYGIHSPEKRRTK